MSRTSRRALSACRATLAGAAVALLLTACGGDDAAEGTAADAAGSATSAAVEGTSAASGNGDFCGQAAGIDERVDAALSDLQGDDPSVADAFRQLATELRGMDAPEAISADWEALSTGLDRMGQAFADLDITDPDSLAGLDAAEGELSTASSNVETYLRDECGIDP